MLHPLPFYSLCAESKTLSTCNIFFCLLHVAPPPLLCLLCPKLPKLQVHKAIFFCLLFVAHPLLFVSYVQSLELKVHITLFFHLLCVAPPPLSYVLVATLTWSSVGVKPNTLKSEDLDSSGTPECLELDSKGKNTSHRGVFGVIRKVLKRRYLKWPRIGHLNICSPSYGQKKGRESNWQFDSQPLKIENRPLPDVRFGSATWR
jgi:hypothetical protein